MTLPLKEWISYIIVVLICILVFCFITPSNHYTPKGIALPMTKAVAQQITTNPNWHAKSTPAYWINLEYHVKQDSPGARAKAMQKAISLAKAAGATHVMMQPLFFASPMPNNNMLNVIIGRGIATK